jgi:glycosyltransferase involved in cell wall biosynthesis
MVQYKKVYIFRHYASPPNLPGGTRHYNVAKAMLTNGHQPYIFLSNFRHNKKEYHHKINHLFKIDDYDGVKFIWLNDKPSYRKNDWRRLMNMLAYSINAYRASSFLKKNGIKVDLVIGSVAHVFAALSGYVVARNNKVEFWLDIGDLWPEGYIKSGVLAKQHPIALIMKILSSFLYRKAKRIIVLTEATRSYLVMKGVDPNKIIVLPNGTIIADEGKLINKCALRNKKSMKITYAGSMAEVYPIEYLIEATKILTARKIPIKVDIIGDGHKKNVLISMKNKFNLGSVKIFGPVNKEDLADYYQGSDVLIVLEKNVAYGFPNKLIDYSFAGKAIILASDGHYDLPDDIYYKIKPNTLRIVDAIQKLYDLGSEARLSLGKKTRNYALENFNMTKNYSKQIEPLLHN